MNQVSSTPITKSKSEIEKEILEDKFLKLILKTYNSEHTAGFGINFKDEYKNGLVNKLFGITIKDKLVSIVIPVFSSEKTITWNNSYLKTLRTALPAQYQSIEDHELANMIKVPLYFFDKWTGAVLYMSLVSLTDWLNHGTKGKNGYSVYFWNNDLPNKYNISMKKLSSEVFVLTLLTLTDKQIKEVCSKYALEHYTKFANVSDRSAQSMIKNISDGLYAQIKVYVWMLNKGYDVSMEWADGDDLGIDIVYHVNGMNINIDVKSTKTKDLKISKNRKETDFYAVCNWKKSDPQFLGLLFKYNFWQSDLINTSAPVKQSDMYAKSLEQVTTDFVTMEQLFAIKHNYNNLKIKRGQRLFNAE